jgi:hypothetical protein
MIRGSNAPSKVTPVTFILILVRGFVFAKIHDIYII